MAEQNVNDRAKAGGAKRFFKDTAAELKKVIWPNRQQVITNTAAVIGMVFVISIVIWLFDLPLAAGFQKVIGSLR